MIDLPVVTTLRASDSDDSRLQSLNKFVRDAVGALESLVERIKRVEQPVAGFSHHVEDAGGAGSGISEYAIGRVPSNTRVTAVHAVPDGAATADASDHATLIVGTRSDGGERTVVAKVKTTPGGSGDWKAFKTVDVPVREPDVNAGGALTFEITKSGAGVSLPRFSLVVDLANEETS